MKSHLRPWSILIILVCFSLACNIIEMVQLLTDPGPMWLERVDVVPTEGSGKFSVSVLVQSHTKEDTLRCEYGIHTTLDETVYRQTVPALDEATTIKFEFTLTQPGNYDLVCTPENLGISVSTTFIVSADPDAATPTDQ